MEALSKVYSTIYIYFAASSFLLSQVAQEFFSTRFAHHVDVLFALAFNQWESYLLF